MSRIICRPIVRTGTSAQIITYLGLTSILLRKKVIVMGSEKSYRGLIARLAWSMPTDDEGRVEVFFPYFLNVVLITPLLALAVTAFVALIIPTPTKDFMNLFVALAAVLEVFTNLFLLLAGRLAATKDFAAYKARIEDLHWKQWKANSDK